MRAIKNFLVKKKITHYLGKNHCVTEVKWLVLGIPVKVTRSTRMFEGM